MSTLSNQTKQCANCAKHYCITSGDREFYRSMNVAPPTWCPDCRLQRRMTFTNERTLYSSTCGLCSKPIITMYHPSSPFPVYCKACWWSDRWDPLSYGDSCDFSRPFFEQFHELKKRVPRCNLVQEGVMEGSEYCNRATNNKSCYLCFRSTNNEDCMYSHPIVDSRDCADCFNVQKSERAYECIDCIGMYHTIYCRESQNCNDSAFLYDCRGCSHCFGCVGLRNKQYHIFNTPYSPEEYQKKICELFGGSVTDIQNLKTRLTELSLKFIHPSIVSSRSEDVTGNWIYDSRSIKNSFLCRNVENGENLFFIIQAKDCKDYFHFGRDCERIYETANCGLQCSDIAFCNEVFNSSRGLRYCDGCFNTADSFGCVGLRKGSYSILNRRYSEGEYRALSAKIIAHMDEVPYRDGMGREYRFGEFFPSELSPVCYNESVAQEFFPLTKERVLEQGYLWRDSEAKNITITKPAASLPETIGEVDDSILKEIIGCSHEGACREQCTRGFKIMRKEFEFYRSMNLPLPRLCPNCRHYERLEQRPSIFLTERQCMCAGSRSQNSIYTNTAHHSHGQSQCPNMFATVYSPDRQEIVYCEECYLVEVV